LTTTVSFIVPVQEELQAVEAIMRSQGEGYHPDLEAALDLIISAGGKRIRPAVTILAGKMLGGPIESLISLAASIELLHTATLVHDDLIDGALLRRGMPTLNSKWSPGATVLTGDFMFSHAAKLAADTNSIPAMKLFAKTLTTIVNGEITQLLSSRCKIDRANYLERIYAKTASVFETAAKAAAIVSDVDAERIEAMGRYGYDIGMAFQIVDDILDFTGEQATVGKPVGSDLRQGIVTLPVLHYAESHPEDALVKPLFKGECQNEDKTSQLIEAIRSSDAIQQSHLEAASYAERARTHLSDLPPSDERCALEDIATYIVDRKF
jgi:geranylgeranyl pyrophosphate synthase